jgi:hypothetical protein
MAHIMAYLRAFYGQPYADYCARAGLEISPIELEPGVSPTNPERASRGIQRPMPVWFDPLHTASNDAGRKSGSMIKRKGANEPFAKRALDMDSYIPAKPSNFSAALVEEKKMLWQPYYGRPLTDREARELLSNVCECPERRPFLEEI